MSSIIRTSHTRLKPVHQAVRNVLIFMSCKHHNAHPKILLQYDLSSLCTCTWH